MRMSPRFDTHDPQDLWNVLVLTLEVFTGHIFGPYSNTPRKVGSKSIPTQIQKLMWDTSQFIWKEESC